MSYHIYIGGSVVGVWLEVSGLVCILFLSREESLLLHFTDSRWIRKICMA